MQVSHSASATQKMLQLLLKQVADTIKNFHKHLTALRLELPIGPAEKLDAGYVGRFYVSIKECCEQYPVLSRIARLTEALDCQQSHRVETR
jgi:hypothetical protein